MSYQTRGNYKNSRRAPKNLSRQHNGEIGRLRSGTVSNRQLISGLNNYMNSPESNREYKNRKYKKMYEGNLDSNGEFLRVNSNIDLEQSFDDVTNTSESNTQYQNSSSNVHQMHGGVNSSEINRQFGIQNSNTRVDKRFNDARMINPPKEYSNYQNPKSYIEPNERYYDMHNNSSFQKSSGLYQKQNLNTQHSQKYDSMNKSYGKHGDEQMNGYNHNNIMRDHREYNELYFKYGQNTHDDTQNNGISSNYKKYEIQYNMSNTHDRVNTTDIDRYERRSQTQTVQISDLSKHIPLEQPSNPWTNCEHINDQRYRTDPKHYDSTPPYTVDHTMYDSGRDFERKPNNNVGDVYEFTAEYEETNDRKKYHDTSIPCYKRIPTQRRNIRKSYQEHDRMIPMGDHHHFDQSISVFHVNDIKQNLVPKARERYLLQNLNHAHKARQNVPERHKPVHLDKIDTRRVREKLNASNIRKQSETFMSQGMPQRKYPERALYDPHLIPFSKNAIRDHAPMAVEVNNGSTQYDQTDETLGVNTLKNPFPKRNNKIEKIVNPQTYTRKDFEIEKINTTPLHSIHKVQKNKINSTPELLQNLVSMTKEKTKTIGMNDDTSCDDMHEDFQKNLEQFNAQLAIKNDQNIVDLRRNQTESTIRKSNLIRNKTLDDEPGTVKEISGGHRFKTKVDRNDVIQKLKQKDIPEDVDKQMQRSQNECKNFEQNIDSSLDKVHLNQEDSLLNYQSSELVAAAILTGEQNPASGKDDDSERKNTKDKAILFNTDEVIKILDDIKHLLMSPLDDKKIEGVLLFRAIVMSYEHNSQAIQFLLNENILSFVSIETVLASQDSTEKTCDSINIITKHSCFYNNNIAKEFLASWIRTLDVCLDDQKHETKVPLLFETLAKIILNSTVDSLCTSLDRIKIFMCVQKVQNLIGQDRIDLHTHILNILTAVVQASKTVDRNLVVTITNIRDITKSILNKELDEIVETKQKIKTEEISNRKIVKKKKLERGNSNNTLKPNNHFNPHTKENTVDKNSKGIKVNSSMKTIEDFMIANSKLFLACGKLYDARSIEDESARQHVEIVQRRNKSLLFLNNDVNQGNLKTEKSDIQMASSKEDTNRKTDQQLEKTKRKMDVITKERDVIKELFKIILDNYKENLIHDVITLDPNKFEYWACVFRIASILIKHSTLKEVKIKQTLRSILEVMNKCHFFKYNKIIKKNRGKNNIDENYTDQLNSIGTFWKAVAANIFSNKTVDILLDENMEIASKIPKNQWLRALTNVTCDIKIKYTILVMVYILNFCQLRIETSSALVNIFQQIINETDLPDYMIKIFLFLACTEKKTGLIDYLTLSIERCADLTLIDTDHDILLTNWNHFGSYKFKLYLVSKYLSIDMDKKRKKFFEKFAESNENLIFTLIHMMLDTPMDKSTLNSISNIISLKIDKDEGNKTIVDYLWSSLHHLLTKYDPAFHDNLAYFLELCFKQLPTILELKSIEASPENTNGKSMVITIEKLNKLIQLTDLLVKFILKIELKEDNLDLLMQLQTTIILILKQTKAINNRRILECNVNNNIPDIVTKTTVLLNDIGAEASPMFTSFYMAYANNIIDLCNKHKIPIEIKFDYGFFFKQLINGDLIYMEQLLKLLQTLHMSSNNPLLLKTINNFQTQFLRNELMYEYVYMFLLNILAVHMDYEHMDRHIFNTVILMLKLNGDAVVNNPFNFTIVRYILKNKSYKRGFLYFVDQLLSLFLKHYVDYSRCVGKPRQVRIVEMVEENMEDLGARFGEKNKTVLANLQEKLSRLTITESSDEKSNTRTY